MKKAVKIAVIAIAAFMLVGGGIYLGMNWNTGSSEPESAEIDESAETYSGNRDTYSGEKNTDTIDIPGFDALNIKANQTDQSVNLYNPQENTVYFKMSIYLSDGTKLWESKLVEPGKAIYKITLNQSLPVGAYENCTLKYECFAMDDAQTPLNGSEIKFTMNALE